MIILAATGNSPVKLAVIARFLDACNQPYTWVSTPENASWIHEFFPEKNLEHIESVPEFTSLLYPSWITGWVQQGRFEKRGEKIRETLSRVAKKHPVKLIISEESAHGYLPGIPSVGIFHQHFFQGKWPYQTAYQSLRNHANAFQEIWIPDAPPERNILGTLQVPENPNIHYTGPITPVTQRLPAEENREYVTVYLSGTETYRLVMERILSVQLRIVSGKIRIIRNTLLPVDGPQYPADWEIHNFISPEYLATCIADSKYWISRPDDDVLAALAVSGRQGILIRRKNHPFEKHLAAHHTDYRNFWEEEEYDFDIRRAVHKLTWFQPVEMEWPNPSWKERLTTFLT